MVFTLHRYIFREVFRVFILSTLALTMMLSLGSILRPVAEFGVGPGQVVHLIGYFLPITLTFVLPMAALFATSLVYGRFAGDNELDACRASGISLLTLVYPALVLAIIVAIANLILSFQVMPAFVQRAERALKADAKQIIFRNIQQKGYYQASDGKYLLYADQVNVETDTLGGVVITEMKSNKIERIITAESAQVKFSPHDRFNEVRIIAYNTYQMGTDEDGGFFMERVSLSKQFGPLMSDNIKFKKIDEIKEIQSDPMKFLPIERMAREVYVQLITELLVEDIREKTGLNQPGGGGRFYRFNSGRKIVEFTAGKCTGAGNKRIELSDGVVVYEFDADSRGLLNTFTAQRAFVYIEGDELAPTMTMHLYDPEWRASDGSEGISRRHAIRGLVVPEAVVNKVETENVLEAVSPASISALLDSRESPELAGLQRGLLRKMQKTFIEIKAEIHSRLVFGIGCVAMILIGTGLGIVKKGGHLLGAFGASCVPAAMLIVFIMMGKNITKNQTSQVCSGLLLMWAGLVVLVFVAFMLYRRLLRN